MTLGQAVKQGDVQTVKQLLLVNPAAIEEKENGMWIPYLAAQLGREEIVRYIVEYSRASFHETDETGRTILHYAVEGKKLSLVQYLVERVGISPLQADRSGITPYELAEELQNTREIVDYFCYYCGFSLTNSYKNPILTGMHPDPSIVCVGDDFYMVNSSFIYFPCIPISHSKDLVHWEVIGHAITNPNWSNLGSLEGGRGYWAPDISYNKGRFYITATYRLNDTGTIYRKQMVTSAERPEGPYCEPVFLDEDGIDPSIFTDDDGRRYMLLNRGARIFELSEDGKHQLSKATLLYYGHQKKAPEGAHMLKKDGWYYLFQAEGGTGEGHRISVSRAKELFGVYTPCPYNPIMRQTDEKAYLKRCGHGKPVRTPKDEWYMVYLCSRQLEGRYSLLGRETALDKITWTDDGWPIVNQLQGPSSLAKRPDLPQFKAALQPDSFSKGTLGLQWITPREPDPDFISLEDGKLFLKGSQADLCCVEARNILLQRQTAFSFTAETELFVNTLKHGQNAGMTCYYDENTYLKFGVFAECGRRYIKLQQHVDHQTWDSYRTELEDVDEIQLCCHTEGLKRTFSYALKSQEFITLGTLNNVSYLCDEGLQRGKRFTGAMIGLYVYSGSDVNQIPFSYFKLRNFVEER